MIEAYPGRLVLGLDARDGKVAAAGLARDLDRRRPRPWPGSSTTFPWPASSTPTSRATERSRARTSTPPAPGRPAQDAGDRLGRRGRLADLERLAGLPLAGCIVGRALYEGKFSLRRGHRVRRGGLPRGAITVSQPPNRPGESTVTGITHRGSICQLATQPPNRGDDTMTTTYHIADIRNVALAGHGASGKTSLADALLFAAGAIAAQGIGGRRAPAPWTSMTRKSAGISRSTATSGIWPGTASRFTWSIRPAIPISSAMP